MFWNNVWQKSSGSGFSDKLRGKMFPSFFISFSFFFFSLSPFLFYLFIFFFLHFLFLFLFSIFSTFFFSLYFFFSLSFHLIRSPIHPVLILSPPSANPSRLHRPRLPASGHPSLSTRLRPPRASPPSSLPPLSSVHPHTAPSRASPSHAQA